MIKYNYILFKYLFMNFIKKILLILVILISFSFVWFWLKTNAADIVTETHNTNIIIDWVDNWKDRNNMLDDFWKTDEEFFSLWTTKWWQGIYYTLVNVAKSLKNLFFWLATIFYLVIALKLLFWDNSDEDATKFKKGIIWITAGLMVMQMAYSFTLTLYSRSIWESLAFDLIDNIINPLIWLMEVMASILFIWVAIIAFYKMVTANWKEEEVSKAKMSIVYAIIWFILIKIARVIVEWVYWKLECSSSTIWGFAIETTSCISKSNPSWMTWTILQIINWANWFVWIITLLLIIYAWFNILFSAWDEEKIKKAKNTILYIVIWLFLLVVNYLILTFFFLPETNI